MRKTYQRLLRENQELRKQIAELENLIDVKDQKHWDYVKNITAAIRTLKNSPTREFLYEKLYSWNNKGNV